MARPVTSPTTGTTRVEPRLGPGPLSEQPLCGTTPGAEVNLTQLVAWIQVRSVPQPSPYDQAVTRGVATRALSVRSRDTSFFGARQVRVERPQERLNALDVMGVIALELHDRGIRQPLSEDIDQSLQPVCGPWSGAQGR
jgi:hypothetical protein